MADCTCDPWGACGTCLDAFLAANWEGVPVVDPSGKKVGRVVEALEVYSVSVVPDPLPGMEFKNE